MGEHPVHTRKVAGSNPAPSIFLWYKFMKFKIFLSVFLIVLLSCTPAVKRPWWIEKRLNRPDILEGLGYAVGMKDKKVLRDTAYNDAIQKLILSSSIQVQGYIETKLFSERDLDIDRFIGNELLNNVNKIIYDTILDRKFFEEFYDKSTGEYWVYVWIPASTISRITVEQTLKTLDKAVSVSEKVEKIRQDLEKDLERYELEEARDVESIKNVIP